MGYRLARARVLMARSAGDEVDLGAVHDKVERALLAMDDVRKIKSQLTDMQGDAEKVRELVEGMAERVRLELVGIDSLVGSGPASQQALDGV